MWRRGLKYKSPYPLCCHGPRPFRSATDLQEIPGEAIEAAGGEAGPPELKCSNGCGASLRPTDFMFAKGEPEDVAASKVAAVQREHDQCCHKATVSCPIDGCSFIGHRHAVKNHMAVCPCWLVSCRYAGFAANAGTCAGEKHRRMIRLLAADGATRGGQRDNALEVSRGTAPSAEGDKERDAAALAIAVGGTPWYKEASAVRALIAQSTAGEEEDAARLNQLYLNLGGPICDWIPHTLWQRRERLHCEIDPSQGGTRQASRGPAGAGTAVTRAVAAGPVSGAGAGEDSPSRAARVKVHSHRTEEATGVASGPQPELRPVPCLIEPWSDIVLLPRAHAASVATWIQTRNVPSIQERFKAHAERTQHPTVTAEELTAVLAEADIGSRLRRCAQRSARILQRLTAAREERKRMLEGLQSSDKWAYRRTVRELTSLMPNVLKADREDAKRGRRAKRRAAGEVRPGAGAGRKVDKKVPKWKKSARGKPKPGSGLRPTRRIVLGGGAVG